MVLKGKEWNIIKRKTGIVQRGTGIDMENLYLFLLLPDLSGREELHPQDSATVSDE